MSATTYLQMVNRVRRRGRHPDLAAVASDSLGVVVGDLLNESKREVLEGRQWDFDVRHDQPLKVLGVNSYTTGVVFADSTNVTIIGENDAALYGGSEFVAKMVVTEDSTYGQTPFRIVSSLVGANDFYTTDTAWPGTTQSALDISIYANEYVLPATVGDVLGVKFNEADLRVSFVDKLSDLDAVYPRLLDTSSSQPDHVYVGGSSTPTYVTNGTVPSPGTGFWIYPAPSTDYILHYSYRYRHPDLSGDTDTLSGVPEHIVDLIVERTFTKALATKVFNDPKLSKVNDDSSRRRLAEAHTQDRSDPNRRLSMRSHDRRRGGVPIGSKPKNPNNFGSP